VNYTRVPCELKLCITGFKNEILPLKVRDNKLSKNNHDPSRIYNLRLTQRRLRSLNHKQIAI